jgi:hypothetical protein
VEDMPPNQAMDPTKGRETASATPELCVRGPWRLIAMAFGGRGVKEGYAGGAHLDSTRRRGGRRVCAGKNCPWYGDPRNDRRNLPAVRSHEGRLRSPDLARRSKGALDAPPMLPRSA